jgi:hypothetical protein
MSDIDPAIEQRIKSIKAKQEYLAKQLGELENGERAVTQEELDDIKQAMEEARQEMQEIKVELVAHGLITDE